MSHACDNCSHYHRHSWFSTIYGHHRYYRRNHTAVCVFSVSVWHCLRGRGEARKARVFFLRFFLADRVIGRRQCSCQCGYIHARLMLRMWLCFYAGMPSLLVAKVCFSSFSSQCCYTSLRSPSRSSSTWCLGKRWGQCTTRGNWCSSSGSTRRRKYVGACACLYFRHLCVRTPSSLPQPLMHAHAHTHPPTVSGNRS